ncbi:MAG TPA: peptidylprolyl isomerase [Gammaproteobacteria bacterium]|nr:peptidylprolyl isomerase [Gammaproteobacteria bacterium]
MNPISGIFSRARSARLPARSALLASLVAAAFSGSVALAQDRELGSGGEMLDGIAAVVEDGVVLKSELNTRITLVIKNLRAQQEQQPAEQRRPLPPQSVLEKQVLDQLVLREIQLQRAKKAGITVSDDQLNLAMSRVAENNGYTLEELPTLLASQDINYSQYREDSRQDLMIDQLQQRDVVSRINISPRELDLCLAERAANQSSTFDYNISHILISVPGNATPEQIEASRTKIESIYARLEAGEDFARLAVATSQAQTALDGGALGWRKGAQLPTLFADVVVKMQPGEFSKPIQSGAGFQIVKLNEMRGGERTSVQQQHVRHILLKPNQILDSAAVQQKIIGIRERIVAGEDFATLAHAQSDDPGSANDGGDLGWISPGELVPEFEKVIAELPLKTLSEPIRTRYGWHLAEVLERRDHDTTDEVKRDECMRAIRQSKAEEERELWLRRLRDQAYVDIRH